MLIAKLPPLGRERSAQVEQNVRIIDFRFKNFLRVKDKGHTILGFCNKRVKMKPSPSQFALLLLEINFIYENIRILVLNIASLF